MKILVEKITDNPTSLLRRAGYVFQRSDGNEMSFVRSFGSSGYPRFHGYTRLEGANLHLSLHLDQKKHTYGNETRHHGEYENEGAVEEEGKRLLRIFGETAKII